MKVVELLSIGSPKALNILTFSHCSSKVQSVEFSGIQLWGGRLQPEHPSHLPFHVETKVACTGL